MTSYVCVLSVLYYRSATLSCVNRKRIRRVGSASSTILARKRLAFTLSLFLSISVNLLFRRPSLALLLPQPRLSSFAVPPWLGPSLCLYQHRSLVHALTLPRLWPHLFHHPVSIFVPSLPCLGPTLIRAYRFWTTAKVSSMTCYS